MLNYNFFRGRAPKPPYPWGIFHTPQTPRNGGLTIINRRGPLTPLIRALNSMCKLIKMKNNFNVSLVTNCTIQFLWDRWFHRSYKLWLWRWFLNVKVQKAKWLTPGELSWVQHVRSLSKGQGHFIIDFTLTLHNIINQTKLLKLCGCYFFVETTSKSIFFLKILALSILFSVTFMFKQVTPLIIWIYSIITHAYISKSYNILSNIA